MNDASRGAVIGGGSERVTIPVGDRDEVAGGRRGFWYYVSDELEWRYVVFVCPDCGQPSTLRHVSRGTGHKIRGDGTVSPSVVCPGKSCKFHRFVVLDDWPPK